MLQKSFGENIAKGLQEFVNPYKLPQFRKDIIIQMKEIEGLQQFNKGLYHNINYENLIKNITQTRNQYRKSQDGQERRQIAQNEYQFWRQYIQQRTLELPDNFCINEQSMFQLKESFDIACERNQSQIQVSKLPKMHYDHAKMYHFNVPMDNRCIVQMIHFHMGYLLRIPRLLSFEELIELYQMKILATYEKSLGQELLYQEICSLAYWNLYDKNQKGYMESEDFANFANIFKFNLEPSIRSIKKEFIFASNLFQGEFLSQTQEHQDIVRWDFYRYIFLERNL